MGFAFGRETGEPSEEASVRHQLRRDPVVGVARSGPVRDHDPWPQGAELLHHDPPRFRAVQELGVG